MAKTCKYCGKELDDNAVFCYNCEHDPDEEKKKSKKWLIVAIAAVIAVGVILTVILLNSGTKGMKFIRVGDVDKISDDRTKDLVDSLSYLSDCDDDDYICILTDELSGDVEVPVSYKGKNVVYVTAYPNEGRNITSLTLNKHHCYLQYLCDFDSGCDALTTVDAKHSFRHISDCFNNCSALTDADFTDVQEMKNSFCHCPKLRSAASFDLERKTKKVKKDSVIESSYCSCDSLTAVVLEKMGYIKGSFNDCGSLSDVKLKSIGLIENSFNRCDAVTDPDFSSITSGIADSFNQCTALTELTVNVYDESGFINNCFCQCPSLTSAYARAEKLDNSLNDCPALRDFSADVTQIDNSVNNCASLYGVNLTHDGSQIGNSFNDCGSLSSVRLDYNIAALNDSFKNCAIDINSVKSEEQIAADDEERKVHNHYDEIYTIFDQALQQLADEGAIPQPDEHHLYHFDENDNFIFLDDAAKARLTAAPKLNGGKFVLYNPDVSIYPYISGLLDYQAEYVDDCRYIIDVGAYVSNIDKKYYEHDWDRGYITTVIVIADAKTGEVIHIHKVGTDYPGDHTDTAHTYGDPLYDEARDYLLSLYQ